MMEPQTSIFGFSIDELYPAQPLMYNELDNRSQTYEKLGSFQKGDLFPSEVQKSDSHLNHFSSSAAGSKRYWEPSEHLKFLEATYMFGSKEATKIAAYVGSKSVDQVRSHAQKY